MTARSRSTIVLFSRSAFPFICELNSAVVSALMPF